MVDKIKLKYYPYTLQLKHTFTVSSYSRSETPVVLTELEYDGITGFGEASLPQYLGETQQSVMKFLSMLDLSRFQNPSQLNEILDYVDKVEAGNNAAKASVDIALHDLTSKISGKPLYKYFEFKKPERSFTSFTFGIDKPANIESKWKEAKEFKFLKVKLGTKDDREIIETIRNITDKKLFVDVNQGWNDKYEALDRINWLAEQNVLLIEQPLPKNRNDDIYWLSTRSPVPVVADESVKRLSDIDAIKNIYSGINIKLMKSTGLREALLMIQKAKTVGLKIMLGCMTETSCAVTAAAHLASEADWIDLDGPLLISNDVFNGIRYDSGQIKLSELPGIGVIKIK